MKVVNRKILGVALEERCAVVSEVRLARGLCRVERTAEFLFPEDAGWHDPQRLGKAFAQFLRQQRFSAGRAVVGLPAKWTMAREVNVPPATPAATADLVRLQAEREFSPDPAALGLDYADALDPRKARPVFLVGALRERLNQIRALAQAARIKLLAVTSSALAVSSAAADSSAAVGISLVLRPGNSDLVARTGAQFCAVRHLVVPEPAQSGAPIAPAVMIAALETEVRRALGTLARTHAQDGPSELTIWDGIGLPEEALRAMIAQTGLDVKVRTQLPGVAVQPGETAPSVRFVPATALGIAGLNGHRPPIDLLHSRLELPPKKLLGRRAWPVVILAALIALAILAFAWSWQRQRADLAAKMDEYAGLKPRIDDAQALEDRIKLTNPWYRTRPRLLDCVRELTLVIARAEGRIWLTKVSIKPILVVQKPPAPQPGKPQPKPPPPQERLSVSLIGVASDERPLLKMSDDLKGVKGVLEPNLQMNTRNTAKNGREVGFSLTFHYVAPE